MTTKPMHVFRVYFRPGCGPLSKAQFELVALNADHASAAWRLLEALGELEGLRLICWPNPDNPRVRVVSRIFPVTLRSEDVESIRASWTDCCIKASGESAYAPAAAEAAE